MRGSIALPFYFCNRKQGSTISVGVMIHGTLCIKDDIHVVYSLLGIVGVPDGALGGYDLRLPAGICRGCSEGGYLELKG